MGGKPVGPWGGRYIWQLGGSSEVRVAWKVTDEDPRLLEQEMLAAFLKHYDRLLWGATSFEHGSDSSR